MKIKELFKKVETYNELAETLMTEKAHIYFADKISSVISYGESFSKFDDFRKHVRREYFKEVADYILNADTWEFDNDVEYTYSDGRTLTFEANLSLDF